MAFTSDLTIDELVLIEEAGFEPLELVLGSSYYHLGYSPTMSTMWTVSDEIDDLSYLLINARQAAMAMITEQARRFDADGIVGVRLDIEREGHHAEFTAVGTAVRRKNGDGAHWRDSKGNPFTCDLSGADFWALIRAGYRPVRLAHGVCVYHVAHQNLGQWFKSFGQITQNIEQPQFTQALYDARELALRRMQDEANAHGADAGVVALQTKQGSYGWEPHVIEFVAVGTAVAAIRDVHSTGIEQDQRPIGTVMVAQDIGDFGIPNIEGVRFEGDDGQDA